MGDQRVLDLIHRIRAKETNPSSLDAETRRHCVDLLAEQGVSTVDMAQLLGVSERTINRDRTAIREANALTVDPKLPRVVAGEILGHWRASMERLTRAARDRNAPAAVRVDAERCASLVMTQCIGKLQSLGFLPMAQHQLKAEVTHRMGTDESLDETEAELERLLEIESGDEQASKALKEIRKATRHVKRVLNTAQDADGGGGGGGT